MKIGIFWYHQHQIIGIAHAFDISHADSLGLIDSTYTHVEYWENLHHQIDGLKYIEYEEIPRGRVIYDVIHHQMVVYMDAKLFKKSIAKQITEFFHLDFDSIKWRKDSHYRTP